MTPESNGGALKGAGRAKGVNDNGSDNDRDSGGNNGSDSDDHSPHKITVVYDNGNSHDKDNPTAHANDPDNTVRILIICGILSFALGILNFIFDKFFCPATVQLLTMVTIIGSGDNNSVHQSPLLPL